ncbi:MAG: hypothetical protein BWY37_01955 [Firmicutes bacterium ADurb.Bin262]|nr:MAG: hypothetical protein BWY37_01955 [Firmicutes bacterium ADurb.Bin262]
MVEVPLAKEPKMPPATSVPTAVVATICVVPLTTHWDSVTFLLPVEVSALPTMPPTAIPSI